MQNLIKINIISVPNAITIFESATHLFVTTIVGYLSLQLTVTILLQNCILLCGKVSKLGNKFSPSWKPPSYSDFLTSLKDLLVQT